MEISVLIEKAQAGDASARKILIEENLGLVHHIVKRFAGRGYEAEDLFQTGTIGLMKAIDHFDLSYDVKFSTYAVPLIAGEIRRFLRDDGPVKVSRSLKDANYKLRQEAARIQTQEGRDPTLRELCKKQESPMKTRSWRSLQPGRLNRCQSRSMKGMGKRSR